LLGTLLVSAVVIGLVLLVSPTHAGKARACHPELDDLIDQARAAGVTFTPDPDGLGVSIIGTERLGENDELFAVEDQVRAEVLCYPSRFTEPVPKPVRVTAPSDSSSNDTVLLILVVFVAIVLGLGVLYIALALWPLTVIVLLAIIAFHMC
jgi:hypothetical protein